MKAPAPYGLTVPRAPHGLAEGKDGKLYLADSIGGSMGVSDPKTKEMKAIKLPASKALGMSCCAVT